MYAAAAAKSRQSCLTLCDPIDGRIKQILLHFIWDLEHLQILVSAGVPGTNPPGIPKENCTCEKFEFKFRDKGYFT